MPLGIEAVAAGAVTGKALYDLVKDIAGYIKDHPDRVLEEKFNELRAMAYSLVEENAALQKKVRECEERLELRDAVFLNDATGACYKGEKESPSGGPYCPKCCYGKHELVPMRHLKGMRVVAGNFTTGEVTRAPYDNLICPVCGEVLKRHD